jgi:hypothetical protein
MEGWTMDDESRALVDAQARLAVLAFQCSVGWSRLVRVMNALIKRKRQHDRQARKVRELAQAVQVRTVRAALSE